MLQYVTVEKRKRRKVNDTKNQDVVKKADDKDCQPSKKPGSCVNRSLSSGSGEFPSLRGNAKRAIKSDTTAKRMFLLKEVKGDLFSCPPTTSLAHCISADCRMGKGIAVTFKKKFGGVKELLGQGQSPGGLATLRRDGREVYYLVTKEKYWQKPTYQALTESLEATKKHCQKQGTTELAMPKIGCGLDGLNWEKVCGIITDVFRDTDVTVTVYML